MLAFSYLSRSRHILKAAYSTDTTRYIVGYEKVRNLIHGLDTPNYALIDVREPSEVDKGYIPTSKNIPLAEVGEAFSKSNKDFLAKYHFEKPNPHTKVVFYCKSGVRSLKALEAVEKLNLGLP